MTRPEPHIVKYCLKVWLTSIIVPPLFFQIFAFVQQHDTISLITWLRLELLMPYVIGLIFSLPYLLLFLILIIRSQKWTYRTVNKKLIILLVNALSITTIFLLLWGEAFIYDIEIMGAYILISSISIIIYKDINNDTSINITLIAIVVIILSIVIYYLIDMSKFANGVKDDIVKKDSFLNENRVRLDSMGTVKYEDYQKIKDSLDKRK